MPYRSWGLTKSIILFAIVLLAGCGSRQERAVKSVTRFEQFYAARDYWNARSEIQKAIAIEDDVAEYWNRLGRAELGLRNYYPAYVAYQRAYELDKNNAEALQAMAELSYSGGKPKEAVRLADIMLEREPRNLRMLLVKAAVAIDDRDFPAARGLLTKMLGIDPQNEGATVLAGRLLFLTGQAAKGAAVIEGSIARTGISALKLNALVDIYTTQHDLPGIIRTYRRLFSLDKTNVGLRLDYAKALYENDQPGHALIVIDQLQRARPADEELKRQIIDLWNMVGSDAIDLDQVRRFAEAGSGAMKLALAKLAIEQGRFADALPILRPFVTDRRINPDNVSAQMLYARALSGLGKKTEAIAIADRVLAFDDTNPDALILRVHVAIDRKDYPAALADAQILGRDNPNSAPARLALTDVYVARNDQLMADNNFARALADIPDSVEILRAYTAWLVGTGRAGMARDVARQFSEQNPRSLKGWETRGNICLKLDDRDCMDMVAKVLDHIHGGAKMRAKLTAALAGAQAAR